MTRSVTVYSVSSGPLLQAIGSRDLALKRGLTADDESQVAAARQLVDGVEPTFPPPSVIHGFELLCQRWGRTLPSNSISPLPSDFLEKLDNELKIRQFPFTLYQLITGGGPLKLPWADDLPTVGHIAPATVQMADEYSNARPLTSDNMDVDAVFVDMADWVEVAAPRGDMLVGFWY